VAIIRPLDMVETEYVYPRLADRVSIDKWKGQGAYDARERAREPMFTILDGRYLQHVSSGNDQQIRQWFVFKPDRGAMMGC